MSYWYLVEQIKTLRSGIGAIWKITFFPPDPLSSTISYPGNPLQLVILPLVLRGVTLLLNVRPIIINLVSNEEFPWLHLTFETLTWDPLTNLYEDQEKTMTGHSCSIFHDASMRWQASTLIINKLNSLTTDTADILHDYDPHQVLASKVVISRVNVSPNEHVQTHKTAPIDFQTLAAQRMVSPERAKKSILRTMQRDVCTCLNLFTLAQQFLTND